MNLYIKENDNMANEMKNIKKQKKEEIELFQNKKEFVEKMTNEKKTCLKEIEKIDKIINNTELLREEYKERNSKLPNKEKIFSISHLADILEKERAKLLMQIKRYNKMIEPKEFVKEKEKAQKEYDFLNQKKSVIDCCKAFLKCAKEQIEKEENRIDIINWMYKLRYYCYIPFDESTYLKDVKELIKDFKEVIQLLTKKAQTHKIWEIFTENAEISYIVIKELLRF